MLRMLEAQLVGAGFGVAGELDASLAQQCFHGPWAGNRTAGTGQQDAVKAFDKPLDLLGESFCQKRRAHAPMLLPQEFLWVPAAPGQDNGCGGFDRADFLFTRQT